MGPGHFAIGLMAKPIVPKVPLWGLLVASEVLDGLCFGFMAAGIENQGISTADIKQGVTMVSSASIPWSHGLLMAVAWSVVTAAVVFFAFRNCRASAIVGLVVLSHWVLDFVVHPPDLPLLFSDSPTVGLGLWTSGSGLVLSGLLELGLLAGGIAVYLITRNQTTKLAHGH